MGGKLFNKTLIGLGALVLTAMPSCGGDEREQQTTIPAPTVQQPVPVPARTVITSHAVQSGEYLSGIVRDVFGIRDVYDSLPEIQRKSGFGPERDTHMVLNGEYVPGQDGYVDVIYPGEVVRR